MTLPRVVIAALGLSLTLALLAAAHRDTQQSRQLSRFGLAMKLPDGWHGTIYRRVGGLPIIHAANFRLPRGDDDTGSKAIKKMRKRSIFVVLMESQGTGGF